MAGTLFQSKQPKPSMGTGNHQFFKIPPMTDQEFKKLQKIIYDSAGIDIKESKRYLLINRLSKRLRNLGLQNFSQYIAYLESGEKRKQEIVEFIDAVTTNKTEFFREFNHFQFFKDKVLPELTSTKSSGMIRIWSAACSSGEEPYSISIFLSELLANKPNFRFEILASDISETILRSAVEGVYDESKVKPVSPDQLRKYFLKGDKFYKVRPEVAQKVNFKKINLKLDFQRSLSNFDVIFCRNVLIYFNHEMQNQIINKCWHVLKPGGYLFLGHSETLFGSQTAFKYIAPSIYRKVDNRSQ